MRASTFLSSTFCYLIPLLTASANASDVVEVAAKSGEIRIFSETLKDSGLDKKLKENGPFTVFAPANSAFQKLSPDQQAALFKDKEKLAQLVTFHVVPGKILVADVKPGMVKTIQGNEIKLKSDNGKITVNDANVTLSDIESDNGVIHIIDTLVLSPI